MCLLYDDDGLNLSSSRIDKGGFPITPPAFFKSDYRLGVIMSFAGIIRESLNGIMGVGRSVLLTVLIECNHSDNPNFILDNKIFPLKRGHWIGSNKRICELTGLSRQKVRRGIEVNHHLTIMSTTKATSKATLYVIDKPDKFLVKQKEQPTRQPTDVHEVNQQLTINNKELIKNNKEKRKKEYIGDFEEFWELYGMKKDRAKCEVKYKRHIEDGITHKAIMEGLRAYQAECRKNDTAKEFIKRPLTWLNGKNWNDEYERELTRAEKLAEIQRNIGEPSCKLLNS